TYKEVGEADRPYPSISHRLASARSRAASRNLRETARRSSIRPRRFEHRSVTLKQLGQIKRSFANWQRRIANERTRTPASSGLFATSREISACTRLRGGAGRTRTSNQTVIAETRVNQGSPH